MIASLKRDLKSVFKRDPAARSYLEVMLCYPGLHAIWLHRVAHWLWRRGMRLAARIVANLSRFLTNVDIHPGADIGAEVFIDHGAGVVIGETARVGEGSLLYQGAVLGGTCLHKQKRHPTLGRNVEIGAGAIILGPITVGDGARVGAGSVVIRDVPPGATVVGVPGRIVMGFDEDYIAQLRHAQLPDPVAEAIKIMVRSNEQLQERVAKLESVEGIQATIDRLLEEKKREILQEFTRAQQDGDDAA
ncbi:MAG TPA: serine O-acetyltransferase [bacterium]|nr:serine O-acetyltransferase [bacterium]HPQ65543.1 serine O-acetyltransferase [bacterium]